MPYFFNGRLYVTPAVVSAVDDRAMLNPNQNVGNRVLLVGRALGGKPKARLTFSSPDEAARVLVGGDLLDAAIRAFAPSAESAGPAEVDCIRVNPATQSALTLKDGGGADVIALTSSDYGLRTGQIRVKVENGTNAGRKLTTQLGDIVYTADDVARNAFDVHYTGAEVTATLTVTNTSVVLSAPAGTPVATIDLNTHATIEQLVDRINVVPGFMATVRDGSGARPALNGLDAAAAQNVRTAPFTATAHLQAVVDWFNGATEGLINAVRMAGAGALPAAVPFTYLTGGVDGNVTNTDWSDAFAVAQTTDVQWLTPCSGDPAIHAMADAHAAFMTARGRERRAFCGTVAGVTNAQAMTAARALNFDRTSLTHLGVYDYDRNGRLVLFPPFVAAAMVAGAFAGLNPGTPMTNKTLRIRGVERELRIAETDALINAGVLCIGPDLRVVKSISTWTRDSRFNRVEQSCGAALDFAVRTVREALEPLKGAKGDPAVLALAESAAESALRRLSTPEPAGPGVLVGDAANPPYRKLVASLQGDVVTVAFECSPVIPVNFIAVSVSAQPFSGAAAA